MIIGLKSWFFKDFMLVTNGKLMCLECSEEIELFGILKAFWSLRNGCETMEKTYIFEE